MKLGKSVECQWIVQPNLSVNGPTWYTTHSFHQMRLLLAGSTVDMSLMTVLLLSQKCRRGTQMDKLLGTICKDGVRKILQAAYGLRKSLM